MRFASAFSTNSNLQAALDEACGAVVDEIDNRIDIAFVFFSSDYVSESKSAGISIEQLASQLVDRLGTDHVIGCCGESIVANQYELQWQPALSIWAASISGGDFQTCHLEYKTIGNDAAFDGWPESLAGPWPDGSSIFTFADPFSFPMDVFLDRMNEDRESVPVMGGIASGASQPGESRLILGKRVYTDGAVLVRTSGPFHVDCVVSQGCRPIGTPLVITRAERNEIHQLGGMTAVDQLKQIFDTLPTRERQMVNQGLQVGRVISEYIDKPRQGDFLIRNVLQVNQETGVIVIADFVRPGQTVQFQVRDQETAHVELKHLLSQSVSRADGGQHAALMFACNGRGTRMFPVEHHDTGLLREVVGPIPVSGFFAAGEIGPVGGKNFLHGFTSSIALFQERRSKVE